jgi:predicted CopG family antitoxin
VSDIGRILLEKGLAKARNKRFTHKQYEKQLKMHHWQKEGDRMYMLRDYKTFFLVIVLNKEDMYECSFSGDKMSRFSELVNKSFSDVYSNLKDAKNNLIEFMDMYIAKISQENQVNVQQYIENWKKRS